MSPLAFYRDLISKGVPEAAAYEIASRFEADKEAETRAQIDELLDRLSVDVKAEARRAKDRARKAAKAKSDDGIPQNSAESAESAEFQAEPLSLPPSPQTPQPPTHTRKELTTRGKRPSRRCPEGWEPTGKTRAVLIGEGYEAGDLERALTRMRDHEFKTARSDWDATFRNWVRQDADRKPRQANERPDPATAKFDAKQANYARAWEGADRAARSRWEP